MGAALCSCLCRFREHLSELRFDLELPSDASAQDVHTRLQQEVEQLTHVQEARRPTLPDSLQLPLLPAQVTLSKFHCWNVKFGANRRMWTFMGMVLRFRRHLEGDLDEQAQEWQRVPVAQTSVPTTPCPRLALPLSEKIWGPCAGCGP